MKLKDLIDRHRDTFDQTDLPPDLWPDIQKGMASPKRASLHSLWWVAACLLVFSSALAVWQWPQDQGKAVQLPASFLSLEKDYRNDLQQIESQIALESYQNDSSYQWIFEELEHLEQIEAQYRADIQAPVPREKLLKVLIDYYEKRLRLLNKLQMEIERNQKLHRNENFNL